VDKRLDLMHREWMSRTSWIKSGSKMAGESRVDEWPGYLGWAGGGVARISCLLDARSCRVRGYLGWAGGGVARISWMGGWRSLLFGSGTEQARLAGGFIER
jgi:hypothetical protein